jgi:hypothetical protein
MTDFRPNDFELTSEFERMWPLIPITVKQYIKKLDTNNDDVDVDDAMDFINAQAGSGDQGALSYAAVFIASALDDGDLPSDWAWATIERIRGSATV